MKRNLTGVLKTAFPFLSDKTISAGAGRVIADVKSHRRQVVEILNRPRRKMVCGVVGATIRGEIEVSVVDGKTGEVVRRYPKQNNLILNRFMENLYSLAYERMMNACAASISVSPHTTFDSGTSTAQQVGTTVSMVSGAFTFDDTFNQSSSNVGNIIKFDSGEERRITARNSATSVEVTANPNNNVATGEFTVYGTNQSRMADVGAGNEERTTTYLTGAGNCETSSNGSTGEIRLTRTFDFPIRVNNARVGTPYKEIGFSETGTPAGSTINSRIILASSVAVDTGQQLRVKYNLIVTISPITPETVGGNPITGWTSSGKQMIQLPMLQQVLNNGSFSGLIGASSPLEPSDVTSNQTVFSLSINNAAHNAPIAGVFQNGPDRSGGATSNDHDNSLGKSTPAPTYLTTNEVHRLVLDKQASFAASVGNSPGATGWGSLCLGSQFSGPAGCLPANRQAFVYVLDTNQTKDSLHSLDIAVRFTWSRILA